MWFCNRRQKVRKLEDERLTFETASMVVAHMNELNEEKKEEIGEDEGEDSSPIDQYEEESEPLEKRAKDEPPQSVLESS